MKKGQQLRIPAAKSATERVHIFGGLNAYDDTLVYTFAANRNSDGFVAWLEHLMFEVYSKATVYLVLDNASFHKSAVAMAAVSLFEDRLQLFWLPAYSPQLNPIERYWRHLKQQACGNHLFTSLQELHDSLRTQLALQTLNIEL